MIKIKNIVIKKRDIKKKKEKNPENGPPNQLTVIQKKF